MNTVTHLVAATALLARPHEARRNLWVIAGALAPDLSMFVFFAWARWHGLDGNETWNVAYWQEPWQTLSAISNSVPIAILLLVIGLMRKRVVITVFALALLSHAALDFPFHADDAHRHFWPLTDWRFFSPLSYWDPDHHSAWVSWLELFVFLFASVVLWRRFPSRWVRVFVTIGAILMIALTLLLTLSPPTFGEG